MEDIRLIIRRIAVAITAVAFCLNALHAQNLNIPNGAQLTINAGISLCVPGDLNLGKGSSGVLNMGGDLLKVTGSMNLDAGSSFIIDDGVINIGTTNYNANSNTTFDGNNQNVMNHQYGNLIFSGSGTMKITGDASTPTTCNNLTINNSGNGLEISENKALSVNGTISNNVGDAGIVLASGSSGDGSLIFSTSNISGTIKRFCSGTQWHYITAPINNAPSSMFPAANFLSWDATAEWGGLGDWNPWSSYGGTNLVVGQGYAYYNSENTVSFEGKMNVSNYTQTLYKSATGTSSYQGWNMVGNPFTSAIDWDIAVADGAVPAGAENAIYFFDDDSGTGEQSNYRYYVPSSGGTYGVGTNDANKNIPIGQGFFVKTNTDNVTLNLKSSYRIHNTQAYYKTEKNELLRLQVIGNEHFDELIIRLINNTTVGFDGNFDARKMFTNDAGFPQIYCKIEAAGENMAINSIPTIEEERSIPLGFKAAAGEYDFSAKAITISADYMYLIDKYLNVKTDITEGFSYHFSHAGGQVDDRFFIFFYDDVIAPTPDAEELETITAACSATITEIPTATDNYEGSIIGATTDPLTYSKQGTYNITWTFDDGNGNITTQLQEVVISDVDAPEITCAENINVSADETGTFTVLSTELDPIEITDNCEAAQVINDFNNEASLAGAVFQEGSTTVVWTVNDGAGNSTNCSQTVKVGSALSSESVYGSAISLFPNPNNGMFHVVGVEKNTGISITDVSGKIIHESVTNKSSEIIDIRSYKSGVYFVKLSTADGFVSKKVITVK